MTDDNIGIDDLPCQVCGAPLGGHTMTEFREHTATDLQFQPTPNPTMTDLHGESIIVDHVDVAASVLQLTFTNRQATVLPAIQFRFWSSDGTRPPPIVFAATDDAIFKQLRQLVAQACDAAPMRARQAARQIARGDTP